MSFRAPLSSVLLLSLLTGSLPGCTWEERRGASTWDAVQQQLGDPKPDAKGASGEVLASNRDAVSVAVKSFSGNDRRGRAEALVKDLRARSIADVWVEERADEAVVYYGRFSGSDDPRARQALRQVRAVKIGDDEPYREAQLVALDPASRRAWDPLDARQHTGYFTLQIGFYNSEFGEKFRQAAENAAHALRDDGEEAYYYHGPHRSLVTLGLFTYDDFVRENSVERYGPKIIELQEEYPHNLANGRTLQEKVGGQSIGAQPSFLVRIF